RRASSFVTTNTGIRIRINSSTSCPMLEVSMRRKKDIKTPFFRHRMARITCCPGRRLAETKEARGPWQVFLGSIPLGLECSKQLEGRAMQDQCETLSTQGITN